jgi:broad specificity phosphatase PhoE
MITLTLMRHGESTDNLKSIWAGWKDAPLTNHGMNQATNAAKYLANMRITAIYASPFKRANSTALKVLEFQAEPKPSFTTDPNIREQHFGEAEGHPWLPPHLDEKTNAPEVYPAILDRNGKFPNGESLNDVAARTDVAIQNNIIPSVLKGKGKNADETHILFVSHGIAISETIGALLRRSVGNIPNQHRKGLVNTGWTRLIIGLADEELETTTSSVSKSDSTPDNLQDLGAVQTNILEGSNPPATDPNENARPLLKIQFVAVNQRSHLDGLLRQGGGIGSAPADETQKKMTDFFGGGGASA